MLTYGDSVYRGSCRHGYRVHGIRHVHRSSLTGRRCRRPRTSFKPIASQANRGVVKFFGTVTTVILRTLTDIHSFKELSGYVTLDEDVGSGDINTPPYMVIRVNVPAGQTVTVQVIYYETSDKENLVGGDAYCADGADADDDDDRDGNADDGVNADGECQDEPPAPRDGVMDVLYTDDEKSREQRTAGSSRCRR